MIRRSFLLTILILTVLSVSAQRSYFLYFQTENQEPFFLKMGEKIYSSTASGYLILPKLRDTTHSFSIGFPGKEAQENFYLTMNHKDHGYLIKHFAEKGWGLFDLQTLGVTMASRIPLASGEAVIRTEKKAPNEFTDLLVKASNDTTLREKIILEEPVVEKKTETPLSDTVMIKDSLSTVEKKSEPLKTDTIVVVKEDPKVAEPVREEPKTSQPTAEVVVVDSIVTREDPKLGEPVKQEPVNTVVATQEAPVYQASKVIRRSESSTTGGFGIVFLDQYPDGKTDTIRILIAPPKPGVFTQEKPVESKKSDLKFLDIAADTAQAAIKQPVHCPVKATEDDFFQLRREMAGEVSDAAMTAKAAKGFAGKCYSTTQIRNLGNLYLNDAGKWAFYQAAFASVTDQAEFGKLQEELKDPVVAEQFRTWWAAQSQKLPQ